MVWLRDNIVNWFHNFGIQVMKCGPVPKHVAIIMDGNRRYAEKMHMQRDQGHGKGSDTLESTIGWCLKLGITELTVFAFSIDNFQRTPEEVAALMELIRRQCLKVTADKERYKKLGIRFCFIGKLSLLPTELRRVMREAMTTTQHNNALTVNLAVAYTGREEITHAISTVVTEKLRTRTKNIPKLSRKKSKQKTRKSRRKREKESQVFKRDTTKRLKANHKSSEEVAEVSRGILKDRTELFRRNLNEVTEDSRRSTKEVTEADISSCLYTSTSPFPDLLIRTSGEVRLSDFMTWQTSFCCMYFTDTLWPEFGLWDLLLALLRYQRSFDTLDKIRREHLS